MFLQNWVAFSCKHSPTPVSDVCGGPLIALRCWDTPSSFPLSIKGPDKAGSKQDWGGDIWDFQLLRWSRKIFFFKTLYVTKGFAEKLGSIVHEYMRIELWFMYICWISVFVTKGGLFHPFSYSCCFWHLDALSACFKSGPGGASGRMESSTNSTGKGHQLMEIGSLKGRQFLTQHQCTVNTSYIKWRFVVSPNRH